MIAFPFLTSGFEPISPAARKLHHHKQMIYGPVSPDCHAFDVLRHHPRIAGFHLAPYRAITQDLPESPVGKIGIEPIRVNQFRRGHFCKQHVAGLSVSPSTPLVQIQGAPFTTTSAPRANIRDGLSSCAPLVCRI